MSYHEERIFLDLRLNQDPLGKYRKRTAIYPDNITYLVRLLNRIYANTISRDWLSPKTIGKKLKIEIHSASYLILNEHATLDSLTKIKDVVKESDNKLKKLRVLFNELDNSKFKEMVEEIIDSLRLLNSMLNKSYKVYTPFR